MLSTLLSKTTPLPETGREATRETCLHHLFEAQAARAPEAAALVFAGHSLTYGHLNQQANRLAHFLREQGVGPETIVGVCAESGREMIVGLLAILKAGGAYLPLDPAYPPERLRFMATDAGVEIILTQKHLGASLPEQGAANLICLDTDAGRWQGHRAANPDGGAGADNLAYVIYTSGSTGQPKGVLLEHRGICSNLRWRQENFRLTASDRMLQTYSFSFDPSVWAIFWPLAAGAALVLPPPGGIADSRYLVEALAAQKITVAGFGPAMLQTLLAHPDIEQCASLRHVFCGGEAMPLDLPEKFHARLAAGLHNVYGPTETTIDAACWTVPRGTRDAAIPIGYPVTGTELLLLDDDLHPVPDGEEGELYVGGAGLARGYLGRPDLTGERFLPHPFLAHPFNNTPGARVYRTGDLARRGPAGEIYFHARVDSQVKLRGFRIELGEIEAILCRHPEVRDAVVALREDSPGEKRLAAYLVAVNGARVSGERLRRFLADRLPSHMVPSAFLFLDTLPLTPSGKRDRKALPPPGPETWERGADFVAPTDPLQRQLAQIWEDLLEIRPLGIRDNFWDLGGHSLLAARMLDGIAQVCGRTVSLSALYESGTIEGLADALRDREEAVARPLATITVGGDRRPFFFLYGFHPLGGFYCYRLARHFHPEQPFYALHPPAAPDRRITIERMASAYIQAIRQVQPDGPYRLGGFCGSGLAAYEIARQLAAQGQAVEFLALVEVHAINAGLRLRLRRLAGSPCVSQWLQSRLLPAFAALQSRRRRGKTRGAVPDAGGLAVCDRAAGAYVPGPYAGPVTLIRAGDDPETFDGDPIRLWQEAAPALTVQDIPGDHVSCLLEHVGGLGECLGACLDALESR